MDAHAQPAPVRLSWILLVMTWFAVLTGLLEPPLNLVNKHLLHGWFFWGPQLVWMSPAANVAFFAPLALAVFVATRLMRRPAAVPAVVFCGAFVAAFGMLSVFYRQLHHVAIVALALGSAAQTVRWTVAHREGFDRLVRRTLPWMVALVIVMGLGVAGLQALRERRTIARLPPPTAGAPNVLLVVLDAVRGPSLSVNGYGRPTTPGLERFARDGVLFQWAFAAAPWTLMSHANMFTGRYQHEVNAAWDTPLDGTYPTLAEVLGARGYRTAGIVGNWFYANRESGVARGFQHYEDYTVSSGRVLMSAALGRFAFGRSRDDPRGWLRVLGFHQMPGRKDAEEVSARFLRWVDGVGDRPFFAFLNYVDAHAPYVPPPSYARRFRGGRGEGLGMRAQHQLDDYEALIAYLDDVLGRLFADLELRGLLENTIVIVTGDHGEEFGEHGVFKHGGSLYLPVINVPLVLVWRGHVPAGDTVDAPVSLADLPATIADLAGLATSAPFPGTSLARYWKPGPPPPPSPVLSHLTNRGREVPNRGPAAKGDVYALVMERFHYIRDGDGTEHLFDYRSDPFERHDLVTAGASPDLAPFRTALEAILNRGRRP